MQEHSRLLSRRRRQRGIALLDGLIAMSILAVGLLAMTRFQARMLAQGSEAQSRLVAAQLADELLSTVRVDTTNAACYTVPATGACGSPAATARTTAWKANVAATLPAGTASSAITAVGTQQRMVVTIAWTARDANDVNKRKLEVTTDVR